MTSLETKRMTRRRSGVLLHPVSLPGPYGVGDLGPEAWAFLDFLKAAGQTMWQWLPIGPTSPGHANSPYSADSLAAGNPLLLSPDLMVQAGLLTQAEADDHNGFSIHRVDFENAGAFKLWLARKAFARFERAPAPADWDAFGAENADWLEDYCLFAALKAEKHGAPWTSWEKPLRDRTEKGLADARERLSGEIAFHRFLQYEFFRQFGLLRAKCKAAGVLLIGDAPIYPDLDSADAWTTQCVFKLDPRTKLPPVVAGVPPDYFSKTGQRWGNPVYDWDHLALTSFDWWVKRVNRDLARFDILRLDHFRGFVGYWEIPAKEKTAVGGRWVPAPVRGFLNALEAGRKKATGSSDLPIIAEDLGTITEDVREVIIEYGLPGMRVLQFAFGGVAENPYAPHNHARDCVVYTGTHDNNTLRGWYENDASPEERRTFCLYAGLDPDDSRAPLQAARHGVRLALASTAYWCVAPLQDLLNLGAEARMNTPSTENGNWGWRYSRDQIPNGLAAELAELTAMFGR